MAVSGRALKHELKPSDLFKTIKYYHDFYKENPTYFRPDGLCVFVGPQGSGKSLSAVNYVYKLKEMYPKVKIVTNLELTDIPFDNETCFYFKGPDDLKKYKNGFDGVIYLIDEIHNYFNSTESKNISVSVMADISQQRKHRKHIVATCQVFGRMAKPLREQFDTVILCKKMFGGYLQRNMLINRDSIDGETSTSTNIQGEVLKSYWYFRSPEMFKKYDTYKVIETLSVSRKEAIDIYAN